MRRILSALLIASTISFGHSLEEDKRLEEYSARGHKWPIEEFVPNTEGWRKINERRIEQIQRIPGSNARYNAWVQTLSSAITAKNFTENGWGLTRAPAELVKELQQKIYDNLETAPLEKDVDVIENEMGVQPLFIPNQELNDKVLRELKPMHEKWAGVELEGAIAYGLRLYQNTSRLLMHVDKANTHVISCILHIDHSEDSEPWPIIIEDFQGNTNEVILEAGDMLFYESSKCFHGRPHTFKGSWYSSIFVHYYPKYDWDKQSRSLEAHYAVPPHWSQDLPPPYDDDLEELVMVGTSMKEPQCENSWCALKNSVKWYGPAIEGEVITTGWKMKTVEAATDGEEL
mmetsp:Transcript_4488/g.8617  ORF Transcript_4488/g.8617 Transcript_4488/m.8617 type:complete len:344 (-) Transcript_4488:14849-15880(-)